MIQLAPLVFICLEPNSGETGKRIHFFFFFFAGKKTRGIINSEHVLKD